MIKAFLFDIGNVLLKFDFGKALDCMAPHSGLTDRAAATAIIDRGRNAYEEGLIDRAQFLAEVFEGLQYRGTEAQFVSAWEDIFEPNEPMLALVARLHGRFPLYLLSNTSDIHRDYLFREFPFLASFDDGVYSYAARAAKPGRAIFEIAVRQLRLIPEETFFIDDLLPNIETARAVGFQAHHYHHEQHASLLAELHSLGVNESADAPS